MPHKPIKRCITLAAAAAALVPTGSAIAAGSDTAVASGSVSGSGLTMTAPADVSLGGKDLGGNSALQLAGDFGPWQVTDGRGTGAGWEVTVTASAVTKDGGAVSQQGMALDVAGPKSTALAGPQGATGVSVATGGSVLSSGVKVLSAASGSGQGTWSVDALNGQASADNGKVTLSLPHTAAPGTYSTTLTFTVAAPAA